MQKYFKNLIKNPIIKHLFIWCLILNTIFSNCVFPVYADDSNLFVFNWDMDSSFKNRYYVAYNLKKDEYTLFSVSNVDDEENGILKNNTTGAVRANGLQDYFCDDEGNFIEDPTQWRSDKLNFEKLDYKEKSMAEELAVTVAAVPYGEVAFTTETFKTAIDNKSNQRAVNFIEALKAKYGSGEEEPEKPDDEKENKKDDKEEKKSSDKSESSDAVEEGAKEDSYEYTLLDAMPDSELFKKQNHWIAFNSNLVLNEFVLPMEHSLRDVLQNQNVYNGVKALEDYLLQMSSDYEASNEISLKGLDCALSLDGGGGGKYGILDSNGNLTPIYATRLYYSSGDSLIPAKVSDLFEITQTDMDKTFVIKFHQYNDADTKALGENAAPQYDVYTAPVYKFDFYTYEYMALASIIDPDLQVNLTGFANHYVSIDMYGNIILASSESDTQGIGKIVIPALGNSYFVNNTNPSIGDNSAASLFNRIFVAGYDFNTSAALLAKSELVANEDGSGTFRKVTDDDVEKAVKENLLGKDKFFMTQANLVTDVSKGLKVEDQADKNSWSLFYSNIQNFYDSMVDINSEIPTGKTVDDFKPEELNNYYIGGLSFITFGTSKKENSRWKYSARIKDTNTFYDGWFYDDRSEAHNFVFGDWTKYQGSVDDTMLAGTLDDEESNDDQNTFLSQVVLKVEKKVFTSTSYSALDFYTINSGFFLEHIDSLAKNSVNKDSWLQSITPTEFAAWTAVVNRFLTKTDKGEDNNVDNTVLSNYCSFISPDSLEKLKKDTTLVKSSDNNFAYNIVKDSYMGHFIRSWDLDGFIKIDAGGLTYVNDTDGTTLETNEERSSNILFYMNKILGDLGSSLTDITAMRLSHEYRSIESASVLNLIFQINDFLEDKFVLFVLRIYMFIVIFLNTLWFITRIINLFNESESALSEYVFDMLKSIALSTLPILLLMFFTYIANWSTSLIFTRTFMYWTGIKLDALNIANVDEDSFTTDLEHFLQITAPKTAEEEIVQLPFIKSDATIQNGKYTVSTISISDLRLGIQRSTIHNTDLDDYTYYESDASMSRSELKNKLMPNFELYKENLFYYFYDVLRMHYYTYYNAQGKTSTYSLNEIDTTNDVENRGKFGDTTNGMSATSGTVLEMINDPVFLFGQSYIDNKDNLGDFENAKDKYLQKLQVQDICEFTDLFSRGQLDITNANILQYVDSPHYTDIASSSWFLLLKNSSMATDPLISNNVSGINPFDFENYGREIDGTVYLGMKTAPGVVLGSKCLYPEGYNPSMVEQKLNEINVQVAKDLLQLNDYKGFTDETIMQLAALVMTIDFNRMMSTGFKPSQTLEPSSLYGKSYGMDTIFTSIYVENSSSLKDVIGQDMIMYTKNRGGFFAQLLLIITLIVGQVAGLLKYLLIIFILFLSMFTFLLVYNFAKDFYSEAWLGLASLYAMQLGIHVIFLVFLAALCTPRTAEISTSMFQGYAGTIKLFILLILFLLQIFLFAKIGIFAAKHYYTLGGDIVKAKFNDMKSAFSNLIAGKGFTAKSTETEFTSDSTNITSENTETEVNEADINAGVAQTDNINLARSEAENAVADMQLSDINTESQGTSDTSGDASASLSDSSSSNKVVGELNLQSDLPGKDGKQILIHADGVNIEEYAEDSYQSKDEYKQTLDEYMAGDHSDEEKEEAKEIANMSNINNFLHARGLDSLPTEVQGSDEDFVNYYNNLSDEDKELALRQRAAHLMEGAGVADSITKDMNSYHGENTLNAQRAIGSNYDSFLDKFTDYAAENIRAHNKFDKAVEEAKESMRELLGSNKGSDSVNSELQDRDVSAEIAASNLSEKFKEENSVDNSGTKLKNTDASVNDTVKKYSTQSKSAFSNYSDDSGILDDDEEDWDEALSSQKTTQPDIVVEEVNITTPTVTTSKKTSKRLDELGDTLNRPSMFDNEGVNVNVEVDDGNANENSDVDNVDND